ncbi:MULTISPECIES: YaaC family protein [unclassified Streptomyces]|uniref:YaaC family protein n=1 Tax=unclassified Streptomyces TaxID=2593676 RepID=UPI0029BAEF7D|nr:hypothetical protein [Streptomyces sp. DK15]MDX2396246.1 hypothetical protein [Streptomyces sp. DK15]
MTGAAGYDDFARRRAGADAGPDFERRHPNVGRLSMHWKMPAETGTQEERLKRLSMLARYQPAQWANHINVDGSRHAVPIEKILERAMDHLPVLSRSG